MQAVVIVAKPSRTVDRWAHRASDFGGTYWFLCFRTSLETMHYQDTPSMTLSRRRTVKEGLR